jgi:uncharacterized protein (UPF0333 family)
MKYKKSSKGQMSLEMIIGLLILLVVAAVVINMFLGNIKSIGGVKKWTDNLKYKEFVSICQGLCNDYLSNPSNKGTIAKYCYQQLGKEDLNANGVYDKIEADILPFAICEDAVYCFHVFTCEKDKVKFDMAQCRQLLCNLYNEIYKDWNKADQKVFSLIPNGGTCDMTGEDYNWWKINFGPSPCINPGSTATAPTATTTTAAPSGFSFSCSKSGTSNVVCTWIGCPSKGEVLVSVGSNSYTSLEPTGSTTFGPLEPGEYTGIIYCGSEYATSQSITIS